MRFSVDVKDVPYDSTIAHRRDCLVKVVVRSADRSPPLGTFVFGVWVRNSIRLNVRRCNIVER